MRPMEPLTGVYELLRQFRTKKGLQPKPEQVSVRRKRAATAAAGFPMTWTASRKLNGEMEVLDVVSEVLEVLRRSGRMGNAKLTS